MALIVFGTKRTPIEIDEFFVKCPSCGVHSWADILVLSRYFHFYWIPFFPLEKEADIICKECGLKRYERAFDKNLISNFEEIKRKYRHPWFTYIGGGIIFIFFVVVIVSTTV